MLTFILSCVLGCSTPSCPADFTDDRTRDTSDLLFVINHWGECNTDDLLLVMQYWGPCPMTLIGYSTHTGMGGITAMNAGAGNTATITTGAKAPGDTYGASLIYASSADIGPNGQYLRITSRGAEGATTTLNTNTPYTQFWIRFASVTGADHEFVIWTSNSTHTAPTGRFCALRIHSADMFVRLHDSTVLNSATATATGDYAFDATKWYRFRVLPNVTTGAYTVQAFDTSGSLVEEITGSSANFGAAVCSGVFFGSGQGTWAQDQALEDDCTLYVGGIVIDNAGWTNANFKIIDEVGTTQGATTANFTANTGTNITAQATRPPDGATTYSESSTNGAVLMIGGFLFSGIAGEILSFSPYWIGYESGASTTSVSYRLIENGVTTTGTGSDPGTGVNFHLRGPILLTMPSDSSKPSFAKLQQVEAGCVLNSLTANTFRCSEVGIHVVYVPLSTSGSGRGRFSGAAGGSPRGRGRGLR